MPGAAVPYSWDLNAAVRSVWSIDALAAMCVEVLEYDNAILQATVRARTFSNYSNYNNIS